MNVSLDEHEIGGLRWIVVRGQDREAFLALGEHMRREIAALTPTEERGRAVGLQLSAYYLGGLLGSILAGLGVEAGVHFSTMFLASAVVDLLGFAALLVVVRPGSGFPGRGREVARFSIPPPSR